MGGASKAVANRTGGQCVSFGGLVVLKPVVYLVQERAQYTTDGTENLQAALVCVREKVHPATSRSGRHPHTRRQAFRFQDCPNPKVWVNVACTPWGGTDLGRLRLSGEAAPSLESGT